MRLISLNINNFGKLQNFSLDFTDNPMVILEDNGWGKSTLAAFIKVMFYGFSGENKRLISEREREKYRPWNKGVYGGRIVYESEGKRYEISKVFGDKEKDDDCVLCDADTRLRILDADAAHLGISLFSLDERSFMRSVFIAQNDVRVHENGKEDIADGISAKIGNLSDATDDVNRYEVVMGRLNDILNKMSPKRATGSIKQMDAHIGAIVNKLREEESVKNSVSYLEGQIRELHDEIRSLREERNRLEQEFTKNAKKGELLARKESFSHLWNQYEASKEDLEKLSESYMNGLPGEKELEEKLNEWAEHGTLCRNIDSKQISLDYMIKSREEELERKKEQKRLQEEQERELSIKTDKRRRIGIILIAAFVICAALGLSLYFVFANLFAGIIVGSIGIISLVLGLFIIPYKSSTSKENDETEAQPDIEETVDTPEIIELKNQLNSEREQVAAIETNIQEFMRYYQFTYLPDNVESSLYDIRQQILVYNTQVTDVENKRRQIKEFEENNDMTAIMNVTADPDSDSEEMDISDKRAILEEQIKDDGEKIRLFRIQLEDNLERLRQMADLKEEMSALSETRDKDMHKYEMLTLTRDYLKLSKEKFSAKYRKPILAGFKKYFSYLSDDESSEFQIDANIHMTKREYGEARDCECYSVGNRDLYDVCLRLALVDAMYENEKPFVILDDPFVNLDKKKTENALNFLKQVAADYQVIYFTCHESRA